MINFRALRHTSSLLLVTSFPFFRRLTPVITKVTNYFSNPSLPEQPGQFAYSSGSPGDDRGRDSSEERSFHQDTEDPLDNKRWMKLVQGCVDIFDELDGLFPESDPRQETAVHVMYRLQEILSRSGVEIISQVPTFDINRHVTEPPDMEMRPGTTITEVISPGFAVGRRVIRLAHVRVAQPFPPASEQTE